MVCCLCTSAGLVAGFCGMSVLAVKTPVRLRSYPEENNNSYTESSFMKRNNEIKLSFVCRLCVSAVFEAASALRFPRL